MRVRNSLINISTGLGSQIIITLLSFVSRTAFITYLGVEYLGVSGLFSNILGMLSLAEAGIGTAIVYNLYKPIAENNIEKINMLMHFYKNAYRLIATSIFLIGLSLLPFLDFFTKDSKVENVTLIYLLFLINTSASYLFTHKISFLNVSQKGYIVTGVYTVSSIIATFVKIGILYFTGNFLIYLITEILITITTSIILATLVSRMYPFLNNKDSTKLDQETKGNIIKNVKALVLHNIGGKAVFGTDNLIIASFVSIAAVGLYSNYYMLLNISRTFINQIFNNINYSVGNLVAVESEEKIYSFFKVLMLFNFWIYSFFSIFLYIVIEPFITLWIGSKFLMSESVLIILLVNFYVSGMRRSISMFKSTAGIFQEDKFAPFFEAAINLIVSIFLVKFFGIAGVFLGTLISTLAVPFWVAPYLVYKKVFKRSVKLYFTKYIVFTLIALGTCSITSLLSNFLWSKGILNLLMNAALSLVIPNIIYIAIFHKTEEFRYIEKVVLNLLSNKMIYRKNMNKKRNKVSI